MNLLGILAEIAETTSVNRALASALSKNPATRIEIGDALKPVFIAALAGRSKRPLIVLTSDEARAREYARDIESWATGRTVRVFSDPDQPAYSPMSISQSVLGERAAVLAELAGHDTRSTTADASPPIVVSSVTAFMRRLTPVAEFCRHFLAIAPGQIVRPEDLTKRLAALGYRRNPLVEAPGEFAVRGGIVDAFPPQLDRPVRIDFFGDEIESVRFFDPESQRSLDDCPEFLLSSASEVPTWMGPEISSSLKELDLHTLRPEDRDVWSGHVEDLERGQYFDSAAFYTMSALPDAANLADYCSEAIVVVDEKDMMIDAATEYWRQSVETRKRLVRSGELPERFGSPLFEPRDIENAARAAEILLTSRPSPVTGATIVDSVTGFEAPERYAGRLQHLVSRLQASARSGWRTVLVSYQGLRLARLLNEQGLGAAMLDEFPQPLPTGAVGIMRGTLSEGWVHLGVQLRVLSDSEIFGRSRTHRVRRHKKTVERTFLSDLQVGDHVVHVEHGIGRFEGIVMLAEVGGEREYLLLEYAKGSRLYVPVDQLWRVQRFVGMGEYKPKLSRLGSGEWERAKSKARSSARDIAADLIRIYSAREMAQGHAFEKDTVWQGEMEDAFAFTATPDQAQAISDVKSDMERARPMDRLVCGDVGFGKTEVAVRAAFKAAAEGAQVAMLVPTTILAQQHFDTFQERMGPYPIRIEMLSRFRSPKDQRKVVEGLADGSVDIVIGTHRLVQDDVKFKNLGVVIIDEEQRFGVAAKERFKKLRASVDVLTLTATPIPRTLHMGLIGVRDISVMQSPPEDRLAVKTYVAIFNDDMVRRAIRSEIARGGQIYFVHNRVQTIELVASRLRELVPEARFVIAHGQMPSAQLENVMVDFASGLHDVLVSSAIIENGMDLPNVNTLIVNECWMFGLSQLYQLRGRVGRAASQAYAYFLYTSEHRLTEEAQKRLQAILEASNLGAGFRLALRDLEIRGAGDLLGADQHGFANAVGFDLYSRMIGDAVDQARGLEPSSKSRPTATVDLPVDAHLPDEYMGGYEAKIREYQRLAQVVTLEETAEAIESLRDRFGEFPEPVANLAYVITVKAKASELGLKSVTAYGGELLIRLPKDFDLDRSSIRQAAGSRIRVGTIGLSWQGFERDPDWRETLMDLLDALLARRGRAPVAATV
ncbi:MAG: transcription-repair coupling factor [Chloroflexi bacterium]|nr:transcription-repair coupling factor [Chloroflexota bacterium]MCY3937019.1 transcription-repair coupling factor [Chloroflexota bacterium]